MHPLDSSPCIAYILQCNKKNELQRFHGAATMEYPMFVSFILSRVKAYFRYRETVRELSFLSDRELSDLGITRWEIDQVARTHSGI